MRKYVDVSVHLLKHSRPMLGTRMSTTNEIMMDASVSEESLSSLGKGCNQFLQAQFFFSRSKNTWKKGVPPAQNTHNYSSNLVANEYQSYSKKRNFASGRTPGFLSLPPKK